MFRAMRQIDLEPRDYRAAPLKREPAFTPGGPTRLGLFIVMIFAAVLVSSTIGTFIGWLGSQFH